MATSKNVKPKKVVEKKIEASEPFVIPPVVSEIPHILPSKVLSVPLDLPALKGPVTTVTILKEVYDKVIASLEHQFEYGFSRGELQNDIANLKKVL